MNNVDSQALGPTWQALLGSSCLALAGLLAAACGGDDLSPQSGYSPEYEGGTATGTGTGGGLAAGSGGGLNSDGSGAGEPPPDGTGLPEEIEEEDSYRVPVATGNYLWSTNPDSGRVALIDATSRQVEVRTAGLHPEFLAAVPGPDAMAIVLNTGSSDASLLRVEAEGISERRVPTHVGANRWALSESGRWAVAYSVADGTVELSAGEGLQEITVIDLEAEPLTAKRVTVGYRPSQIEFDLADTHIAAVSDEGISLVQLAGAPEVVRWIDLGNGGGRDVALSADLSRAIVRRTGQSSLEIVSVSSKQPSVFVDLLGPPTDLDLSKSGRAVAVVRERSELVTFALDEVIADPADYDALTVPGELFGSAELTDAGERVVLFTTATASDRVTVVNLTPGAEYLSHQSLATKTPVSSVVTSPDGAHAIVRGVGTTQTAGAFSVIALKAERFPRVVGTAGAIRHIALGDAAGVVTISNPAGEYYAAHLVQLPALSVTEVKLASPPLSAGILAEFDRGYASQTHPAGRVTFFDLETAEARTLTGYELASEVVNK